MKRHSKQRPNLWRWSILALVVFILVSILFFLVQGSELCLTVYADSNDNNKTLRPLAHPTSCVVCREGENGPLSFYSLTAATFVLLFSLPFYVAFGGPLPLDWLTFCDLQGLGYPHWAMGAHVGCTVGLLTMFPLLGIMAPLVRHELFTFSETYQRIAPTTNFKMLISNCIDFNRLYFSTSHSLEKADDLYHKYSIKRQLIQQQLDRTIRRYEDWLAKQDLMQELPDESPELYYYELTELFSKEYSYNVIQHEYQQLLQQRELFVAQSAKIYPDLAERYELLKTMGKFLYELEARGYRVDGFPCNLRFIEFHPRQGVVSLLPDNISFYLVVLKNNNSYLIEYMEYISLLSLRLDDWVNLFSTFTFFS